MVGSAFPASQGEAPEVGEEEQGVPGCARLTSDRNSCGRKNALLGRLRSYLGACQVSPPTQAALAERLLPHPGPNLGSSPSNPALGWSVHQPGEAIGLRPPAPVLRRGPAEAGASFPRCTHHSRRDRGAPVASVHIVNNLQEGRSGAAYCLLPIAYSLLPTPYSLLPLSTASAPGPEHQTPPPPRRPSRTCPSR